MIAEQTGMRKSVGKRTYSVDEVREILGISRRKAYDLCNSDTVSYTHLDVYKRQL